MTGHDGWAQDVGAQQENGRTGGTSVRRLAELAKAGYLLTRDPTLQVDFEVHHVQDVPGYFYSLVNSDSAEPSDFLECLAASANGVGFVFGTRAGSTETARYRGDAPDVVVIDEDDRKIFRGVATPNPSFTFESARTFEAIISVGGPRPEQVSFARSLVIKEVLGHVSQLAADTFRVPMLSAQWPAQIPVKVRGRPDVQDIMRREEAVPPHASSGAIRFSLAIGDWSAAQRMRLERQLIRFVEQRGFGLWFADSRLGYRTGNWFHVRGYDPTVAGDRADTSDPVTICLPVTFVGPARTGSTSALLKLLESLPFVGLVGFSSTTLDDLAFIHLQLSVRGLSAADLAEANRRLADSVTQHGSPPDVLADVFRALDLHDEFETHKRGAAELAMRAFDYKTLVRNVFRCTRPPRRRRMAIWFSWQVECEQGGLQHVMRGMHEAFRKTGLARTGQGGRAGGEELPNLEYLICRQIDNSLLRGKGKISLPKDIVDDRFKEEDGLERPASRFSMNLEAAWKAELAGTGGFLELTVVWREAWLGHWEPVLY